MGYRSNRLSKAIVQAIVGDSETKKSNVLSRILAFFRVFSITLSRFQADLFQRLRRDIWSIDEKSYRESFDENNKNGVISIGDLGYSGSAFFATYDSKYLIKSLPRRSEYHFFSSELLMQYNEHMIKYPNSLLVRITDFLHAPTHTVGGLLRITPAHHIVMENILYGKEGDEEKEKWETYDLKPVSYFYPERDLAGGNLASNSVKERLLDTFDDRLRVSKRDGQELIDQLSTDSKLLEECNVVDYSLFLVRYPKENKSNVSPLESKTSAWRAGVKSTDGKWIYRAVLLDYFWAKHKLHAQTMTGLIKGFNLISGKGHMSITTTADDYRRRFLLMVETLFETPEE